MSGFLDGLGSIFTKATNHVQGRIERLKNEKIKLLEERHELFIKPSILRNNDRLNAIDSRLREINTILGNKATD